MEAEPRGQDGDRYRGPVVTSYLPLPLEDVVLVQSGAVSLPRDQPAAIWQQRLGILPQIMATLTIALDKRGAPRRSGFRKNHADLEMSCLVGDVGLPVLRPLQETLADIPFDVEFVYVSPVLHLTP